MLEAQHLILPLVILSIIVLGLVVFIIVILVLNKKVTKKLVEDISNEYNSYKDKIKEQNELLVNQIVKQQSEINRVNNSGAINTEKDLMSIFIKLREAIKENCTIAMNQTGAARLAIYLLHNGTRSSHGINFFKLSCICEKVAIGSGVRERMIEHSNIPINLFDEMIDKLITYNRYIIMNDDDNKNTNHKIFISEDKITYTQLVTIYDINNNMLGFVEAEMQSDYSKDKADEEKQILDELVKQIMPVLSYSDYISAENQMN